MRTRPLPTALALALVLFGLVVAGCGSDGTATTTSPSASAAALAADVQAIKDAGVLRVGVKDDVPGFSLRDPATGELKGMEVDLAYALAEHLGLTRDDVELQVVTTADRGQFLDDGKLDMVIASFTITPERAKQWNFSDPYAGDFVGLLVERSSGIDGLAALEGKKIGVLKAATTRDQVQAVADKAGVRVEFVEFSTNADVSAALESGRVDAFAGDKMGLAAYATDGSVVLPDDLVPQDFGVATKKGTDDLTVFINGVLAEMQANGDMDALLKKWGLD
jgi:putative glutamine transport system substrate-binding protein